MVDIFINAIKLLAVLSSGFWGYIALIHTFRNEDGAISKWGKRAIGGIVTSTALAIGLQAVETYKAAAQAREDSQRTQAMLQQLARAAYPLLPSQPLSVFVAYSIDISNPKFSPYRARIDKWIKENCQTKEVKQKSFDGSCDRNAEISFRSGSSLMPVGPSIGEQALAELLGRKSGLYLAFYRGKFNDQCRLKAYLWVNLLNDGTQVEIRYGSSNSRVEVKVHDLTIEDQELKGVKGEGSLIDLNGAYLYASFRDIDYDDEALSEAVREAENAAAIEIISIHTASRSFFLGENDMPKSSGGEFGFLLPNDLLASDVNVQMSSEREQKLGNDMKPLQCLHREQSR